MEASAPGAPWRAAEIDSEAVGALVQELQCSSTVAALLWIRGVRSSADASRFLEPALTGLADPDELPDMDRAVARLIRAIDGGERICVHGDYDVDGLTATASLVRTLRQFGVRADVHIPHRIRDGYGLRSEAMERIAASGATLLVTVDGGANDRDAIACAGRLGLDVIVTDHHPIADGLPDGVPVVHPARSDCCSAASPLAGVGVAYKLIWALGRARAGARRVTEEYRQFLLSTLAYVALGTVADVVPLTGENRVLVHYGLRALAATTHPGLRALMAAARTDARHLDAEAVAFRLAPLINAAGRLGRAEASLDLLLCDDDRRAGGLASRLVRDNGRRKEIEGEMLRAALDQIDTGEGGAAEAAGRPLVVAGEGWHPGVAGIVAARLVDRFARPAFVVALADGQGRGSGRGADGWPLTAYYEAARDVATSIGGHAMAGGITVPQDALHEIRRALGAVEAPHSASSAPEQIYDLALPTEAVTGALWEEISRLAPFGRDNPTPRFRLDGLRVDGRPRLVGRREEHLSCVLHGGGRRLRAIYFGGGERASELARHRGPFSALVEVFENDFGGPPRVELRIVDLFFPHV